MGSLPLHPLVVHIPLALAVLLPVVVAVVLWLDLRGKAPRSAWYAAAALAALLTVGAFFSVKTGEAEEDTVEELIPETALESHEERAESFLWASLAPLVILVSLSSMRKMEWRRAGGVTALVASVAVAGMAILVGESGGSLVYQHNAGAAYVQDGSPAPRVDHESDDDD